jgi:hypothetical protein
MLSARGTVLTSFMNEYRIALTNFRRFAALKEPDCLLCCVYGGDGNMGHLSQNCPLLLDGRRCFKCLELCPSKFYIGKNPAIQKLKRNNNPIHDQASTSRIG